MDFDDGHKDRVVGVGVVRRRTVCFGVFGVWLHLISGMGSEYCQAQPLNCRPGCFPSQRVGISSSERIIPVRCLSWRLAMLYKLMAARLENAKSGISVEGICAAKRLRSWVDKSVYSVYISVQYYSSSNAWLI